jgi:hypothetical protein
MANARVNDLHMMGFLPMVEMTFSLILMPAFRRRHVLIARISGYAMVTGVTRDYVNMDLSTSENELIFW